MSVIFRTVERPSDPRVENSPKKYFPQLITLGQTVDLAFIAQKMQDRSSLSIGDIKSTMQNFVEKLKEQLLEGKTVNIAGLGVFLLAAKSKGEEKAEDVTAKSVDSVRIFFQANKELKITKTATRAGEKFPKIWSVSTVQLPHRRASRCPFLILAGPFGQEVGKRLPLFSHTLPSR